MSAYEDIELPSNNKDGVELVIAMDGGKRLTSIGRPVVRL